MTKENLVTCSPGTTLEQAKQLLHEHRIEKLLVVDKAGALKGLITVKDIQKQIKYPNACKDSLGRLRVGAAVGAGADLVDRARELIAAKVDILCLDSSHGHSRGRPGGAENPQEDVPLDARHRRQRRDRRGDARPDPRSARMP